MGRPRPGASQKPAGGRLAAHDRIRTPREFQRVSREGRRASSRSFVVLVAPRMAPAGSVRIGLTVSRQVGGAVLRNRMKRRLREWFRTSALRRSGSLDVVVIARRAALELEVGELRAELDALGHRAAAEAAA